MVTDPDGTIRYVSPSVERVLGYRPEEMVGTNSAEYVHPDDLQRAFEELGALLSKSGVHPVVVETRVRHKDASWRHLEGIATNLLDDPAVEGLVFNHRDVTDRMRAEEEIRHLNEELEGRVVERTAQLETALAELRESEQRYRLLVESVKDYAIFTVDANGRIAEWNVGAKRLFGYSEEEIVGKPGSLLFTPEDIQSGAPERELRKAHDEGRAVDERWHARKDGSRFWASGFVRPVRDEDGNLRGFVKVMRDFTERRRVEEALERQARQAALRADVGTAFSGGALREVLQRCAEAVVEHLDAALARVWTLNVEENVLELQASAGMYTHLDGAHSRVPVGALKIGLIAQERKAHLTNTVPNDPRVSDKEWARREGMVAFAGYPLVVEDRLVGVVAMFSRQELAEDTIEALASVADVIAQGIERKQTEEALRKSEERYRSLVAASTSIVWTIDPEGRFVKPQPSWEAYTGQPWEEHKGFGWVEALHPDDRERVRATWEQARDRRSLYTSEGRLWHAPSRSYRYFVARATPLFEADGPVREWIGMVTDVDAQKRAEEEIRRLNEQLEQRVRQRTAQLEEANKELESFSYSVSHDLRAPIRHIGGFAQMLQSRAVSALDETSRRYLKTIVDSTDRAGGLIDDLLSFSRTGRAEMHKASVDMNRLVEEVLNELRFETDGRDIEWKLGWLPEIRGDPSMLRLVVQNLFSNALKFTRPRQRAVIEVGSAEDEAEIVFFVRDNGVGFDERYAEKLYGVFQRLHGSEEFEGSGIGLASVARVVHRHGGRVWAEGRVGEGATFYFSLPTTIRSGDGQTG